MLNTLTLPPPISKSLAPPKVNNGNQKLIVLDGITKIYLTEEIETHALSGIHLKIEPGEFVLISGPSGCGKSTLLSIIGLLDGPTDGGYRLGNMEVSKLSLDRRANIRNQEIGFIFQSFNLIGDLSVYENVELPLAYRGLKPSERKSKVLQALEKVDMIHRKSHLPNQLSGGQQQRVAVARALAGKPQILLADEPTGNLDSKNGKIVMEMLKQLNDDGATICMVTHDERYAKYARRVVHLFDGKIVDETSHHNQFSGNL